MFNVSTFKNLYFQIFLFGIFGFLYYFLFRTNIIGLAYFNINNLEINIYSYEFLYSLPSLFHIIILSLITYLILDRKNILFSIFFWLIVNIIFELIQSLSDEQLDIFPSFIRNYGTSGTFDWLDIIFLFLGAVISGLLIKFSNKNEVYNDIKKI